MVSSVCILFYFIVLKIKYLVIKYLISNLKTKKKIQHKVNKFKKELHKIRHVINWSSEVSNKLFINSK